MVRVQCGRTPSTCHACWVKAHSPAQPQNLVSKTPPKHTQLKRAVHCLWESRVWLHRTLKKAIECPGHQLLLMMMSQASRGTAEPAVPGASQGAGRHRVGAPLSCSVLVGLLRPSTRAPHALLLDMVTRSSSRRETLRSRVFPWLSDQARGSGDACQCALLPRSC